MPKTRPPALPPPPATLPANLQFFSPAEIAIILGVSRKVVAQWIKEGLLPIFRPGAENSITRIRRQDFEHFIEQHMRGRDSHPAAQGE